jgi:hypothetical protein
VLASYVLRLVPSAAARGEIVGEVESVATGTVSTVRDVAGLLALVTAEQSAATGAVAGVTEGDEGAS